MDLFAHSASSRRLHQPLAERMRPQSLEELVGQEHVIGPGRLLAQVAAGKALPSLLLWGPPGTGKTTVARILGRTIGAQWVAMSAVSAGVKEVREVAVDAAQRRDQFGAAHAALPRRDPSLLEVAAGRAPAARRGGHVHPGRRDDRESVVRRGGGAAVATAGWCGSRRCRPTRCGPWRCARSPITSAGWASCAPTRRRTSSIGSSSRPTATRAACTTRSRSRRSSRGPRRPTPSAWRSPRRTSRRPRSTRRSSTTRPATSTTAWCRRSSRACAAAIPTRRCTG